LKPAEENGLIARLWECAGSSAPVKVQTSVELALKAALKTDHLEHNLEALPIEESCVLVPVKPRGITTLRLVS
jgi:hypothetical protein